MLLLPSPEGATASLAAGAAASSPGPVEFDTEDKDVSNQECDALAAAVCIEEGARMRS